VILSNVEIHAALDAKRLIIDPEPTPRFPSLQQPDCPYQTTAVDLQLSAELQLPSGKKPFSFDLRQPGLAQFLAETFKTIKIDPHGAFTLQPGQFVLGRTIERVSLPIVGKEGNLAARVEGRSSFARCGLVIHFTAPTIHSGFDGTITLELMNSGPNSIVLSEGMKICQLIIEEVRGQPIPNTSQFQGQSTPSGIRK
jgi:dCTP deaminase